jgi:hypothetical protein
VKARELAEKLMQHPDADVYIEYIPWGDPIDYDIEYMVGINGVMIDTTRNESEFDDD